MKGRSHTTVTSTFAVKGATACESVTCSAPAAAEPPRPQENQADVEVVCTPKAGLGNTAVVQHETTSMNFSDGTCGGNPTVL